MRYRSADTAARRLLLVVTLDVAPLAVLALFGFAASDDYFSDDARLVFLLITVVGTGVFAGATYGVRYGWKRWWDRALRDVDMCVRLAVWDAPAASVRVYVSLLSRSPLGDTVVSKLASSGAGPMPVYIDLTVPGHSAIRLIEVSESTKLELPAGVRKEFTFEAKPPVAKLNLAPGRYVEEATVMLESARRETLTSVCPIKITA